MSGLRSGCAICLLAVAAAATAVEPLEEAEFDALLESVHLLNRWNPVDAVELARPAEDSLAFTDSLENRVRVMVALAPERAMRLGYRPARHELVKMLGPVKALPVPMRGLTELRFGLSDLAIRHGDIRYGMRQIISAFHYLEEDSPDSVKARLLEQVARVNLSAGYPADALYFLDLLAQSPSSASLERRFSIQLLRAEALGDDRAYNEMSQVLDELAEAFSRYSDPSRLAVFWVLKTWEAIYRGRLDEAATYLRVTTREAEMCGCLHVIAETAILEAMLMAASGEDAELVADKLSEAEIQFSQSGIPARFSHLLIRIERLPREVHASRTLQPFLEQLVAFAHREVNLRAQYRGLAAWAAQMQEDESTNPDLLADTYRKSLEYGEHFNRTMGKLQVDLLGKLPGSPVVEVPGRSTGNAYYLFILLLIALVLVLVLALRIHSQLHMNARLAKAVSQAKAAEEAAAESSRMKTQFLANVSHEIKTPMSGLIGMASLLDELITEPTHRKYLKTIRTCSGNLLVLMNDLLDLSRMEFGRFEIEHRPVKTGELVNYAVELVRESANQKDLQVIQRIEPEVPGKIVSDGTRISQIMTNLLSNAIKFTERGTISINLRFELTVGTSGNLIIEVSDTGIGIPRERLPSVFEPFNKGPSDLNEEDSGSGLGLAICKKLTELMGGSIQATSEPGNGSCFTVRIPVST